MHIAIPKISVKFSNSLGVHVWRAAAHLQVKATRHIGISPSLPSIGCGVIPSMRGVLPLALTKTITSRTRGKLDTQANEIVHLHAEPFRQTTKRLPSRFFPESLFDVHDRVAREVAPFGNGVAAHASFLPQLLDGESQP